MVPVGGAEGPVEGEAGILGNVRLVDEAVLEVGGAAVAGEEGGFVAGGGGAGGGVEGGGGMAGVEVEPAEAFGLGEEAREKFALGELGDVVEVVAVDEGLEAGDFLLESGELAIQAIIAEMVVGEKFAALAAEAGKLETIGWACIGHLLVFKFGVVIEETSSGP